jgi:hypothetical protein
LCAFFSSCIHPNHLTLLELIILIIFGAGSYETACHRPIILLQLVSLDISSAWDVLLHSYVLSSHECGKLYTRQIRSKICDWNEISVAFSFVTITRGKLRDVIGIDAQKHCTAIPPTFALLSH